MAEHDQLLQTFPFNPAVQQPFQPLPAQGPQVGAQPGAGVQQQTQDQLLTGASPFAAAALQDIEPPKDAPEKAARRGLWAKFLKKIQTDDDFKMQLRIIGLSLASTPDPSQNAFGHVSKALQAGLEFQLSQQALEREKQKETRAFKLKEREVTTQEKRTASVIARERDQRSFNKEKLKIEKTLADAQLILAGLKAKEIKGGGAKGVNQRATENLAKHLQMFATEQGTDLTESEAFIRATNMQLGTSQEAQVARLIGNVDADFIALMEEPDGTNPTADALRRVVGNITQALAPSIPTADNEDLIGRKFTQENGRQFEVVKVEGSVATVRFIADGTTGQVEVVNLRNSIRAASQPNSGPTSQ